MNDLKLYIEQYYLGEIPAYELADKYFEHKFYSAAATFYMDTVNKEHESTNRTLKSYCLMKIAECHIYQEKHAHSGWQHGLIMELLKTAVILDPYNIQAYLDIVNFTNDKNTYHWCKQFVLNALYKVYGKEDTDKAVEIILEMYKYAEHYYVIEYKITEECILKFLSNNAKYIDREQLYKIMNRMKEHQDYVSEHEHYIINKAF